MAETNATILIPDISGFTEFMTTTELTHSSHAINMLMDAILKAVAEEYEVSEIEGDAVLLIKKGTAPSQREILNTCLNIFNSFHTQRMWIQQHAICPCGACQAIINLTLKFVVHHGPLTEIRVGRFVKPSGAEMIVAHRLLKNSIDSNEYLLMTEKLLQHAAAVPETGEMEWTSSSEEYASIGRVDYRYALLNEARKKIPEPPAPATNYGTADTPYLEIPIEANFRDVYMVLMNVSERAQWLTGLQKVQQDMPGVFVGSIHLCSFENFTATISPLRMVLSEEGIMYAEKCSIPDMNLSLVHEFSCIKAGEKKCIFSGRFINTGDQPVPEDIAAVLSDKLQQIGQSLKTYCENMAQSFFEPVLQKN